MRKTSWNRCLAEIFLDWCGEREGDISFLISKAKAGQKRDLIIVEGRVDLDFNKSWILLKPELEFWNNNEINLLNRRLENGSLDNEKLVKEWLDEPTLKVENIQKLVLNI